MIITTQKSKKRVVAPNTYSILGIIIISWGEGTHWALRSSPPWGMRSELRKVASTASMLEEPSEGD